MNLLKVSKEEFTVSLPPLALVTALNVMAVIYKFDIFTRGGNLAFWTLFHRYYSLSGFDKNVYIDMSRWACSFNTLRHPLLSLMIYPFYLINSALMKLTEINFTVFIWALLMVIMGYYSFILLYRLLRNAVGNNKTDSALLAYLFFSFGYVMLSFIVPDHFALSLFVLLLSLRMAVAGREKPRPWWQWALLYLFATGITVTNGVMVLLAEMYALGRRMFRPAPLLLGVIAPTLLLATLVVYQQRKIVMPHQEKVFGKELRMARKDTLHPEKIDDVLARREKKRRQTLITEAMTYCEESNGRGAAIVHNLFGESIQIHEDYLLKDVYKGRPSIVKYRHWWNYAVEALVMALLAAGLWAGRREPFLRLLAAWLAFNAIMHLVFNYDINEVYIMTAHWAFVIPLAAGYLFRRVPAGALRIGAAALTLFLLVWNMRLLARYLL